MVEGRKRREEEPEDGNQNGNANAIENAQQQSDTVDNSGTVYSMSSGPEPVGKLQLRKTGTSIKTNNGLKSSLFSILLGIVSAAVLGWSLTGTIYYMGYAVAPSSMFIAMVIVLGITSVFTFVMGLISTFRNQ